MCNAPPRSHEQRLEALGEANRIRTYRCQAKRELAAGERDWHTILDDPEFASANAYSVALTLPRLARVKVTKAFRRADASLSKTIGGLSPRQRVALTEELAAQMPPSVLRRPTIPNPEAGHVVD